MGATAVSLQAPPPIVDPGAISGPQAGRGKSPRTTPRRLRARYVADGERCLVCNGLFYPVRTISGLITEHFCSGDCAWIHYIRRTDPQAALRYKAEAKARAEARPHA